MMGYSQSRVIIALLLFSVLLAFCSALPTGELNDEVMEYDDQPFDLGMAAAEAGGPEATEGPTEEKRAVFRMGKRAMMRFGKRAMMRFGKRSVFRLG